jgi:GNAT superfamily N-acetyltransferase
MDFSALSFIRLTPEYELKPFDCNDADLNGFLLNDARPHIPELLSVTYLIEDEANTISFFSLLNDKITLKDVLDNKEWNKIRKVIPFRKKFKSYPAMKIGRLGVSNDFKGHGYGKAILDYLKILFITKNRTGCRFITVDAYAESLGFYEKNGFDYLTSTDLGKDTRLMFFDLKTITGI